MRRDNCYVVTGGMGFGKTTLVHALARYDGIEISAEIALQLVTEQLRIEGDLLPWKNRHAFERELIGRRSAEFQATPSEPIFLFDRGLPDTIAFLLYEGLEVSPRVYDLSFRYLYNKMVFWLPEWEEIFRNTPARPQTFEESAEVGRCLRNVYVDLGYDVIEVPKGPIEKRCTFVLTALQGETS